MDNVAEFQQMVTDHTDVLKRLGGKVGSAKAKFPKTMTVMEALTKERNTWLEARGKTSQELAPPSPGSERQV